MPRIRVLAVDDDPSYLRYLSLILTRRDFDVELADDGNAAVTRIRENAGIALVLVDLAMPDMDGFATLRKLRREAGRDLYAILLTAHDEMETKLRALDSGFDDFLSKHATESEIVAKLRSAVRRVEMERTLRMKNQELETLALTDDLTGIANRRGLLRAAAKLVGEKRQLSIALFDLDHFKVVNDTCGHLAGDLILTDVAACLKANTRYGDILGRYGGDEFLLLLPETNEQEAEEIATRLAEKIERLEWSFDGVPVKITASVGVSGGGGTVSDLLAECDRLLYRSKRESHGERKAHG